MLGLELAICLSLHPIKFGRGSIKYLHIVFTNMVFVNKQIFSIKHGRKEEGYI